MRLCALLFVLTFVAPWAAAQAHKISDSDHTGAPPDFVWNNALEYKGRGTGEIVVNDQTPRAVRDVRVDIDLAGKVVVFFTPEKVRGTHTATQAVVFTGTVLAREDSTIKADMVTEDHRLHGTMSIKVGDKNQVRGIGMSATDGQGHLRLTWQPR